jgi:PAS domain S-box-containing protein
MTARVLIVDDSLTVRMDISEALEAADFDVIAAGDIAGARAALADGLCELIILDVQLPDGDGLDFLKELKGEPATQAIPVLLLSNEAEVANRVRGIAAGACEYIGKPYDLGQLLARARALVQPAQERPRTARTDAAADGKRRILVIDDSATYRNQVREALEGAGYAVQAAETGEEGLTMAAASGPDAVIVDGNLPGIDGVTVVRRLKSDTSLRSVPCVLLTAAEGTADELRSLEAGADAYIRKSEDLGVILVRLAALLRRARPADGAAIPSLFAPKRLLAVDDSRTYLEELGERLREEGYDVVLAASGAQALELLAAQPVDCILLDLMMPDMSGEETCRRIKQSPLWRDIPLVMLTARDDRNAMIEGINAGADDYIAKNADFEVLKARLRAQLRRKHFEDENRRINEQLVRRETERDVFERFFAISLDMMCIVTPDGYFQRVSRSFDVLGYSLHELTSQPFIEFVHADDCAATLAEFAKLHQGARWITIDNRFRCKDGSHRWLSWVSGPDSTGTLYGIARDVTDTKQHQEELARAKEAAEAANAELESFSYSVAHDLRAPLRSIDGFSQALLEDAYEVLDAGSRKYLGFIRESATHMAQLIDDLLALSRVTRSELRRERLDLGAIAHAAIRRLQREHPQRQVEILIQDETLAAVDPRLFAVVFDNLLGNAWKYTGKRVGSRIEFSSSVVDGHPVYCVRDNGAGFDMAYAGKLFGVFQRLHSAAEFEGTGVGLATIARIIRRHGGRVWAEAAVDQGASFYFTLDENGPA